MTLPVDEWWLRNGQRRSARCHSGLLGRGKKVAGALGSCIAGMFGGIFTLGASGIMLASTFFLKFAQRFLRRRGINVETSKP